MHLSGDPLVSFLSLFYCLVGYSSTFSSNYQLIIHCFCSASFAALDRKGTRVFWTEQEEQALKVRISAFLELISSF